jgi:hypothetical protein
MRHRYDFRDANRIKNLKTQYDIAEKKYNSAGRNYDTAILAWQTTQGICL